MFFTALIILIILILVGNYVYHYYSKESEETQQVWPPTNYMTQMGAQCPDMWTVNPQGNKVVCNNKFALPPLDPSTSVSFPLIKNWPVSKKNSDSMLKPRCNYLCSNPGLSWSGISSSCNNSYPCPAPSS